MTEKVLKKLEAVSLSEANEVKMEARSEIYMKFHVNYCFASSRHDCLRHPTPDNSGSSDNFNKLWMAKMIRAILPSNFVYVYLEN